MRTPLLLALALALVTVACADSQTATPEPADSEQPTETATVAEQDADPAALDRVAEAAANTVDAGTASFTLTVEAAQAAGDDGARAVVAEGEEDFANQLRLLTFTGGAGELRVVIDTTTVYVELPATEGDDWARIEVEELLADAGFGGPGGLPFQSAADNLVALENAVVAATEAGTEDVNGVPATRYDLTVDLESAGQDASGEVNDTFSALADTSGVTDLAMSVWVDDEDHIARVSYALDLSQAGDVEVATEEATVDVEPSGEVSVTVDYSGIGEPVDIDVPDEASIVDIDEDEIRDSLQQQ